MRVQQWDYTGKRGNPVSLYLEC